MPKYDYFCDANQQTIEVSHPMSASIATWGELCSLAGTDTGDTAAESPVHKLLSGSFVSTGTAAGAAPAHSCAMPSCCGGTCSLD